MNILTNICNPKDQHFEQESKTQTYKPLNDYIFQNRSMQKMRAKYQKAHSSQQFKYQSWNHPYSISNFNFQQNTQQGRNGNIYQSMYGVQQYTGNVGNQAIWRNDGHHNKKISFKDVNLPFCGVTKQEQQGQKHFRDRDQYYTTMKETYPPYNYKVQNQQDPMQQQSFLQQRENLNMTTQSYSHSLLNKQILQLKQQNKDLKRVIQEQYKPMKELYNKLLAQQQEREYLISKLQWKVKQLVKEMGHTNTNVNQLAENFNKQNKNQQVKPYTQLTKPKSIQNNYTVMNNYSLPYHNPSQNVQHVSNYTNISTYFPQNNMQNAPLNQFEPHNISCIAYGTNTNYQSTQQNNYFPSSYYQQQNTNNLSKSLIIQQNNLQSRFIPNTNQLQTISKQNNQHFSQNIPIQQFYNHNVSQMSNFQINKNY